VDGLGAEVDCCVKEVLEVDGNVYHYGVVFVAVEGLGKDLFFSSLFEGENFLGEPRGRDIFALELSESVVLQGSDLVGITYIQ